MKTGQRLAFVNYVEHSRHHVDVVDIGSEGYPVPAKLALTLHGIAIGIARLLFRKPDCVYITTSRSPMGCAKDIVLLTCARLLGVPVVNHLHGNGFQSFRDALPAWARLALDTAYGAVRVSIVLADGMRFHYGPYASTMKVVAVTNCSEKMLGDFPGLKAPPGEPLRVLFLSNYVRLKGVVEFVRGLRALQERRGGSMPLKVRMIGNFSNDPSDVTPAELANELDGIAGVEVLVDVDEETKWRSLACADVFVFMSHHPGEAAPLSVIEAVAMGCLPVVTQVGYVSDLVRDTVHLSVPQRDSDAVADALESLLTDRTLVARAREVNVKVAEARYTLRQYTDRIDDIVEACS
jgi:glycosyltransferase involved in cell wall biosynthesis